MRIKRAFYMALFFLSLSPVRAEIIKNNAIFSLQKKIYFSDDLNEDIAALLKFKCLGKSSILWKALSLEKVSFSKIDKSGYQKGHRKMVEALVTIKQIIDFTQENLNQLKKNSESLNFPEMSCLNAKEKKSLPLQLIFALEIYLRDRFMVENKFKQSKFEEFVKSVKQDRIPRYYFQ